LRFFLVNNMIFRGHLRNRKMNLGQNVHKRDMQVKVDFAVENKIASPVSQEDMMG